VNPQFGIRHLRASSDVIVEEGLRLIEQWEDSLNKSSSNLVSKFIILGGKAEIDVSSRFGRLTLDVMAKSFFGFSPNALTEEHSFLSNNIGLMFAEVDRRMKLPSPFVGYWRYLKLATDKRANISLEETKAVIFAVLLTEVGIP
jgi:hypothetical protein